MNLLLRLIAFVQAVAKVPKDLVTERDGVSYCIVRVLGTAAGVLVMWKFYQTPGTPDYAGLAASLGTIGAIIIGKQLSER